MCASPLLQKYIQSCWDCNICSGLHLNTVLPNLINGSYPSDIDLYVLYIIFLANTSVSYFAFAYKSVLLTADQHQNIISNIDTILCILRYGIQIAMLIIISNYYAYIIWNLILQWLTI